jgi:TonB family protein
MKTKILSVIAVLMLTITFSYAKDAQSTLQQTIRNEVQYPASALAGHLEGAVFVEFTVTPEGKIEVLNCNSLVGELQSYVFETISEMTVVANPELIGKTFQIRIDFKLV